jgi:serine/threonine-protein kinase
MLKPGDVIEGKYRIVRLLGQGGMGAVYEGENTRIHRKVAIKVLHAGVAAKADVVQRFEREAQAAGRIGSEHIVEVLDLGNLPQGERYMVMEYLDGENLGDRIKTRRRLPPQDVAPIILQVLEGLKAAHAAGIVHRDLKPDNVFLITKGGRRDFVKVLDFGVSKFSALDDSMSMTKTGAVMGTPYYMSPEQARGAKIDARSDLYSVGVVMYQAVTGRVPFSAETFNELVFKIALESPEPPELVARDLDPAFASIIARAMIRDVNLRFQTGADFQAAITQWLQTGAGAPAPTPQYHGGLGSNPSHPGYPATTPQGGVRAADASGPHAALIGMGGMTPQPGGMYPGMGHTPQPGMGGHTPQPGMSGSGPYGQSYPGSPQLGASHAGMVMTAPQPRRSGAMIAIGLLGTLVVAAGAFGIYKAVSGGASAAAPPPTAPETAEPQPPQPPPVASPQVPATTPAPVASPAPAETATAAPGTASGTASEAKVVPKGPLPKKAPTAPTGAATAAPKATGRVIGGDL